MRTLRRCRCRACSATACCLCGSSTPSTSSAWTSLTNGVTSECGGAGVAGPWGSPAAHTQPTCLATTAWPPHCAAWPALPCPAPPWPRTPPADPCYLPTCVPTRLLRLVDEIVWVKMTVNRRMAKSHGFYLQHAKEVGRAGGRVGEGALSGQISGTGNGCMEMRAGRAAGSGACCLPACLPQRISVRPLCRRRITAGVPGGADRR